MNRNIFMTFPKVWGFFFPYKWLFHHMSLHTASDGGEGGGGVHPAVPGSLSSAQWGNTHTHTHTHTPLGFTSGEIQSIWAEPSDRRCASSLPGRFLLILLLQVGSLQSAHAFPFQRTQFTMQLPAGWPRRNILFSNKMCQRTAPVVLGPHYIEYTG